MSSPELSQDEITEMAISILQATDDGDQLVPDDLALVELAVNRGLNARGRNYFAELHKNATKPGGYTSPWLFGIEHLTIDVYRWVRWKGVAVETFEHHTWQRPGWRERMRADAEALAACCRRLEARGIKPTLETVKDW